MSHQSQHRFARLSHSKIVPVFLHFYRLCFHLSAQQRLSFPMGKAGNVLRGAFGSMLRKLYCRPQCSGAATCPFPDECPYNAIFEPRSAGRFLHRPRPFVFRADHLDGQTIEPGCSFEFEMNLFSTSPATRAHVVNAFSQLTTLGASRSLTNFLSVETQPMSIDLTPGPDPVHRIQVLFQTPTELKAKNEVASQPEFPILYARAAERVSAFCPSPPPAEACPGVQLAVCSLIHSHVQRRSSKTGQTHRLGGFTGEATYQGDLRGCFPILQAAEFTGVGRHTSWGNGRLRVLLLD